MVSVKLRRESPEACGGDAIAYAKVNARLAPMGEKHGLDDQFAVTEEFIESIEAHFTAYELLLEKVIANLFAVDSAEDNTKVIAETVRECRMAWTMNEGSDSDATIRASRLSTRIMENLMERAARRAVRIRAEQAPQPD